MGRLERVEPRTAWSDETVDFTPWLARGENIALLGRTLGLELKVEAREKPVGSLSADLVCRDELSSTWVVIENQLGRTDHRHLGQLLSYAAGLDAVTVIWIASCFTAEHRAAVEWLNSVTEPALRFFGLEIQLWRIDGSAPAPRFHVACAPFGWSRLDAPHENRVEPVRPGPIAEQYWSRFLGRGRAASRDLLEGVKPSGNSWLGVRKYPEHNAWLAVSFARRQKKLHVKLELFGAEGEAQFKQLYRSRREIESRVGAPLIWCNRRGQPWKTVCLERGGCDLDDRAQWDEQHLWLVRALERFQAVFPPPLG